MFNALVLTSIGLVAAVQVPPYIFDALDISAGSGPYGSAEYQATEFVVFVVVELVLYAIVRRHEARG